MDIVVLLAFSHYYSIRVGGLEYVSERENRLSAVIVEVMQSNSGERERRTGRQGLQRFAVKSY
jgi:hypothetical protein